LFSGINWVIHPGKRAALIGPNGAGKTTLFRILNSEIISYKGRIIKSRGFRIGYLPQEQIDVSGSTVLQTALEGQPEVIALENKITELHNTLDSSSVNQANLLKELGVLEHRYEALGGYKLEALTKSILSGLGFAKTDFSRPLSELSGGWHMRVYLARLLVQKPDLLLLDEPTNHLDLQALEWLEQYLLHFSGSIVIVSHDRFFIDRLAHEIFELECGKLNRYKGNYHFYEQIKQQRLILLHKKWEEQKKERERLERFIKRFQYKATKAAQVQSRIKQLEKIDEVELPTAAKRLRFELTVDVPSYKDVLRIENMSFRYDERWILKDVDLNISRGEKISLVGVNGSGKTTLARLIAGDLSPQVGSIKIGKKTSIGYYAQHQVTSLDLEATVYEEVSSSVSNSNIPRVRDVLGIFHFSDDEVFKRIEVLSGGEKARISLAKILLSPVNFLIMDEPTNHLDIASLEALEEALTQYDGTLLVISHDRYFLDKLVGRVVEIDNAQIKDYLGDYSDYLEKREKKQTLTHRKEKKFPSSLDSRKTKEKKRLEAEARQEISKERSRLNNEIERLERRIEELETGKREIENEMERPETYQDAGYIVSIQKKYADIRKNLQSSYERWGKAKLELEEIMKRIT